MGCATGHCVQDVGCHDTCTLLGYARYVSSLTLIDVSKTVLLLGKHFVWGHSKSAVPHLNSGQLSGHSVHLASGPGGLGLEMSTQGRMDAPVA
jgi:hypothetical protein